jgi:hypothetical protein
MGKISDYANVLKSKLTDLFVVYQRNNGELETKNATLEQLGDAICGEQVHSDLETDDKTIIGGINENKDKVGDLTTLTTTDKSSIVVAVNEVNDGALRVATFDFTKVVSATTQVLYSVTRTDLNLPTGAKVKSAFLRENTYNTVNAGGLIYSARANESASYAIEGAIYNGTNASRTYSITATVFYTLS